MITAKEFANGCKHDGSFIPVNETIRLMIEFAQMHVAEALRIASEEAETDFDALPYDEYRYFVDKDSILNAYPLEDIK